MRGVEDGCDRQGQQQDATECHHLARQAARHHVSMAHQSLAGTLAKLRYMPSSHSARCMSGAHSATAMQRNSSKRPSSRMQ